MSIEAVAIATNRNAPEGATAINLYNTDLAQGLTLGQLMASVCLRVGANLESQSIAKANIMNKNANLIAQITEFFDAIAGDLYESYRVAWGTAKKQLEQWGVDGLPDDIDSYDNRMLALQRMKERLDALTQVAQEDMIDFQTLVNRRDVAFTTSTNLVKSIQASTGNTASQF